MNNTNFSKTFLIWKPMFKINQIWIERKQDSKQHHYRKTPIIHNTVYKLSLWLHLWVAVIKLPLIDNIHVLRVFNDAIFLEGLESEFLFISAVKYMRLNTFEDLKQKHYGQTDRRTDGWTDPRIEMRGRI